MSQFYAYIHCKPDGRPFYVGKGTLSRANNLARGGWHQNIVNKHGKDNIAVWKFICDDEKKAFDLEIYLIAHYRRIGMTLCNMTNGGEGSSGYVATEETRAKISASRKGWVNSEETRAKMYGKIHSVETRAKISAGNKGKIISEDTRAKISAGCIGRICSEETRAKLSASAKGKTPSDETRIKISAAAKRRWNLCSTD